MFTKPLRSNVHFFWLHSSAFRRWSGHTDKEGDLISFLSFFNKESRLKKYKKIITKMTLSQIRKVFKVKVKVILRPTVSRPVLLGCQAPSGAHDQIFLRVCWCGVAKVLRDSWPCFTVADLRLPQPVVRVRVRVRVRIRIRVTLRLTVSQSGPSWCRSPSGAHDQIFIPVRKLLSCLYGAPSLTRGRVCHFPQPVGPGPLFISPRNRVAHLYLRALGSLSVASYDSQGYGGDIRTRFHTARAAWTEFDSR
jgi:hypothetical protein